jgi:hypothetical protein
VDRLGRRRVAGCLALAAAGAVLAAGAGSSASSGTGVPGAAADVRTLGEQMEALHPNLFATISRSTFRSTVGTLASRATSLSANELLVGMMRLAALPGNGNGHGGIFPGDPAHKRKLHLYPLRLYAFPEGTYVVDDQVDGDLVGARILAVAGEPYEQVARRVEPLVPRDNTSSLRGLLPHYLLTAEVLTGLGIVPNTGPVRFTLRRANGRRADVTLAPIPARRYAAAFADPHHGHYPASLPWRPKPLYQAASRRDIWLTTLGGGRTVYVGYNTIFTPPIKVAGIADRVTALARRQVERIVIDLRLNGGGDNTTYGPLLQALTDPRVNRRGRLYVLIGRATFSAAANLAADIDRYTRATFVGEPTGGGVKIYGDSAGVLLDNTGLDARIPTRYWDFGKGPRDRRLAVAPDRTVVLKASDYFAGRDPVLAAALARP